MKIIIVPLIFFSQVLFSNCTNTKKPIMDNKQDIVVKVNDTATFGAGCFWCVEAVFASLKGVDKVVSGYSGGKIKNPTYKEVCSGLTGHAEVVRIYFDSTIISFEELLEIFWQTHDPTTLNRQGADVGTQYRSVVFYHNQKQKEIATSVRDFLNANGAFDKSIVTEISEAPEFYVAEDYHQQFYELNKEYPYCRAVILPKMDKLKKLFAEKLKQ
jgi:peptide-methionine (S)-S-oxide reductase